MIIKQILDEDFVNYKKASMVISFPHCTFKCGKDICQNSQLALSKGIEINTEKLVERFINNPITEAVVIAGLEPFDDFEQLIEFIDILRAFSHCDIVIYSGYNKDEILDKLKILIRYSNIIIKFGRYIPNQKPHFDKVLGIELASDNQYAEKIS